MEKRKQREEEKRARHEEGWKILEEKSTDEIYTTVYDSFREIIGEELEGDIDISLGNRSSPGNFVITCKPSVKKDKWTLIGKDGVTATEASKRASEKLGVANIFIKII